MRSAAAATLPGSSGSSVLAVACRGDRAVAAGPRARVAHDLERRRAAPPALPDVRAARLLADRVQAVLADDGRQLAVAAAGCEGARTRIQSAAAALASGLQGISAFGDLDRESCRRGPRSRGSGSPVVAFDSRPAARTWRSRSSRDEVVEVVGLERHEHAGLLHPALAALAGPRAALDARLRPSRAATIESGPSRRPPCRACRRRSRASGVVCPTRRRSARRTSTRSATSGRHGFQRQVPSCVGETPACASAREVGLPAGLRSTARDREALAGRRG